MKRSGKASDFIYDFFPDRRMPYGLSHSNPFGKAVGQVRAAVVWEVNFLPPPSNHWKASLHVAVSQRKETQGAVADSC